MAIDFPSSPTAGQLYVAPNGVSYQWSTTYTAWLPLSVTSAGVDDFFAQVQTITFTTTPTVIVFTPVVTGNSGGWYSTSTGRYTPPAGRYCLNASIGGGNSTVATTLVIQIRKNGTAILNASLTTGAANFNGTVPIHEIVDANGTDYFEIAGSVAAGASTNISGFFSWFSAFPISAAGPATGTGSSWRQIARVVPTAGQATVDFQNIPSDINDLEVRWDVTPTANANDLILQFYDNTGTLDATSGHYVFSYVYGDHTGNAV